MPKHITRLVPVAQLLPPLFSAATDETSLEGCKGLRENFIVSGNVSVDATDHGYIDAGIFGTMILAE